MEVKLKENNFEECCEVFSQVYQKEDNQDCVVPDTMPDIGSILSCTGTVLIRGKDVSNGRVRLEANIPVRVLYRAEEGEGLYSLEINLPVFFSLEDAEIDEECSCVADMRLALLEARTLNPRKITVRAETAVRIRCFRPAGFKYLSIPDHTPDGLNLLESETMTSPVWSVSEKTFVLTDTIPADSGEASPRLISSAFQIEAGETRTNGSKLILNGRVCSTLLCQCQTGEIKSVLLNTPFHQIIEIGQVPEESLVTVCLLPSGVYYELGTDGKEGNLELHLVAQIIIHGRVALKCVTDAYSNRYPLDVNYESRDFDSIVSVQTIRDTLQETIPTPQPIGEMVQTRISFGLPQPEENAILLPVSTELCYLTTDGTVNFAKRSFQHRIRYTMKEGETVEVDAVTGQQPQISQSSSGAELHLPLEVRILAAEKCPISMISEIRMNENELLDSSEFPTLEIFRVSSSDNLWEIAKRNHSTIAEIKQCNALEEAGGSWDKLLLIPKTV